MKQRPTQIAHSIYLALILFCALSLGGCRGGEGSSIDATIPIISVHPTPATVAELAPATFVVTAFSEGPLTYQWLRNGRDMVGATHSVLTLFPPRSFDASQISVRVSNAAGASISRPAFLTVVAKDSSAPSPLPH